MARKSLWPSVLSKPPAPRWRQEVHITGWQSGGCVPRGDATRLRGKAASSRDATAAHWEARPAHGLPPGARTKISPQSHEDPARSLVKSLLRG